MAFQSQVNINMAAGVAGEFASDGAHRVQAYQLDSAIVGKPNTFGFAYTQLADGIATVGGAGAFAGILVNPKSKALYGTATGGTLAPSLDAMNLSIGELCSKTLGSIWVMLPAAAAIGDLVCYSTTTGALSTVAAGTASAPAGTKFVPNATVYRYSVNAPVAPATTVLAQITIV
jgi:hypothetical protein